MIDIRILRNDPQAVLNSMARRHKDDSEVRQAIDLDVRSRSLSSGRDGLRAQINTISKDVGEARKNKDNDKAETLMAQSRELGEQEQKLATEADDVSEQLRQLLLVIPNVPSAEVPEGATEDENPVLFVKGKSSPEEFETHQHIPHWETATAQGWLDLERGAKLSGSMFPMYKGEGAQLLRALIQYGLNSNIDEYEEVRPPSLVKTETMISTGHLPKFVDDAYAIERDELWAIPTAEVPLTSYARDEIIDESQLPMRFVAYTPCYRREAGSAGRDTRGLLRVHEFDKVELLAICTPDQGPIEEERIFQRASGLLEGLGLNYRAIAICAGDLGQSHHHSRDLETYAPGVGKYLEVSSVSWYSDYQARRANMRFRRTGQTSGTEICHTVNGSALATPRVWATIIETYRNEDGTVTVPEVLRGYMANKETIGRPIRP